jgi:hypothetical protein
MENKIPEFSKYLEILSKTLNTSSQINIEICLEVEQSLTSKFNEYLIKGYGTKNSILYTIKTFEDPEKLAKNFNKVYKEENKMPNVQKYIYNKYLVTSSFIMIFLVMLYSFIFSLYNFISIAGLDYGKLGWHAMDNNVVGSLIFSTVLMIIYTCSLYNIAFKKILPPKMIIWAAYINFFLVMAYNFMSK